MVTIRHGFTDYKLSSRIETLIVGTFNPGPPWVDADFFYSSPRNYFWSILPAFFGQESLKGKSKTEKLVFCERNHIGFIDLIKEVKTEEGRRPTDRIDTSMDAPHGV